MGAGSPEFDSDVRGVFAGITMETGKGHFIRAIMESVGCMIRKNIEPLVEKGIHIHDIRVLGGGARSALWNQIKADITGIPVTTLDSQDNAALGAAILAGVGAGVFEHIKEGCERVVKIGKTYHPDPANRAAYDQLYARYNRLYESLIDYWK
jgi:xylulokinase